MSDLFQATIEEILRQVATGKLGITIAYQRIIDLIGIERAEEINTRMMHEAVLKKPEIGAEQ